MVKGLRKGETLGFGHLGGIVQVVDPGNLICDGRDGQGFCIIVGKRTLKPTEEQYVYALLEQLIEESPMPFLLHPHQQKTVLAYSIRCKRNNSWYT